jgi:hypothetical protein
MRWKAGIAAALGCVCFGGLSLAARAQTTAEPPAIAWQIEVVRDGTTIDTFEGTTGLGQAVTATHHHETVHRVGCKDMPAAQIDLVRTLTVSPVAERPDGIMLAIDAQDTIEDDTVEHTPEGCALPPEPRRITAAHPGLIVPSGQWANWTIINSHPALVYRVRADIASH